MSKTYNDYVVKVNDKGESIRISDLTKEELRKELSDALRCIHNTTDYVQLANSQTNQYFNNKRITKADTL